MEPARLTGKVIGFRAWGLAGHKLISPHTDWLIGVNEAKCLREFYEYPLAIDIATGLAVPPPAAAHRAPAHNCTCGLYAWYEPNAGPYVPGTVVGAVLAWGHIEAQAAGFRAQYAEPVLLAYTGEEPYNHVVRLQAIASEMGVGCVPFGELGAAALKLGRPVPNELRPPPTPWGTVHFPSGGIIVPPPVFQTHTIVPSPRPARGRVHWLYDVMPLACAGAAGSQFVVGGLTGHLANLLIGSSFSVLSAAWLWLRRRARRPPT